MSKARVLQLIGKKETMMASAVMADDLGIPYSKASSMVKKYINGDRYFLLNAYGALDEDESVSASPKKKSSRSSVAPAPPTAPKASGTSTSTRASQTTAENEYLEELRFALEGGSITPRERRFLNKIRSLLGISEARGAELESSLKKRRLFVSYSRSDKEKVMDFLQLIERETGESCWMDLTGIESGSQFEETIIKAIDDSEIVLFMMSDNSVASPWTKREVYYAESEGKKIVPISLDGKGMRGWFKFHFAHIDCIDSSSRDQVKKLVSNIKSWLS